MITPKIKALFQFIDFLHSNIENFNQYENEINELRLLGEEREKVYKKKNFAEKQKYDRIQLQIGGKVKVIQDNIVQPIRDKANELSICSPEAYKTETLWNWNSAEIIGLKEKVSNEDLPEIFNHKNKYIEYRTKTKVSMLFGLPLFFDHLDEVLKELFSYFNETEHNEFEAFETKEIFSNSIAEALELQKQGYKVAVPLNLYNPVKEQQGSNTEPLPPQTDTKKVNTKTPKEKTLSGLITHQNSLEIVEGIKIQYKNIKGKRLKLLLLALQELGLFPKERIAQKFYDCCKAEFSWDIATYQAMNGYQYNEHTDKTELIEMKQYLKSLMNP